MSKKKPPSTSARMKAKGYKPVLLWVSKEQHAALRAAATRHGFKAMTEFILSAATEKAER